MRHPLAAPFLFLSHLLLLFPACSSQSKEETAVTEMMQHMEQLVTTLEGVKDEASAKAAGKKLEPILARMRELSEVAENLAEAEQERLGQRHKERSETLQKRLTQVMMKLMTDEKIEAVLSPVFEQMGR